MTPDGALSVSCSCAIGEMNRFGLEHRLGSIRPSSFTREKPAILRISVEGVTFKNLNIVDPEDWAASAGKREMVYDTAQTYTVD